MSLEAAADFVKALAEPARLRLLQELRRGERSLSELIDATGLMQVNAWKHLQILERLDLVCRRREGRRFHYSLGDDRVFLLISLIQESLEEDAAQIQRVLEVDVESIS